MLPLLLLAQSQSLLFQVVPAMGFSAFVVQWGEEQGFQHGWRGSWRCGCHCRCACCCGWRYCGCCPVGCGWIASSRVVSGCVACVGRVRVDCSGRIGGCRILRRLHDNFIVIIIGFEQRVHDVGGIHFERGCDIVDEPSQVPVRNSEVVAFGWSARGFFPAALLWNCCVIIIVIAIIVTAAMGCPVGTGGTVGSTVRQFQIRELSAEPRQVNAHFLVQNSPLVVRQPPRRKGRSTGRSEPLVLLLRLAFARLASILAIATLAIVMAAIPQYLQLAPLIALHANPRHGIRFFPLLLARIGKEGYPLVAFLLFLLLLVVVVSSIAVRGRQVVHRGHNPRGIRGKPGKVLLSPRGEALAVQYARRLGVAFFLVVDGGRFCFVVMAVVVSATRLLLRRPSGLSFPRRPRRRSRCRSRRPNR
mmetsp:Transcript_2521/g.5218  ORF Transcript_2521/g.5218 Transcript_2521/m.5218 type:complete len:417 (+) Transcript_2521:2107-3357(+)